MTNKTYYIQNSTELDDVLDEIEETFPCFIDREFIEMDYSEIAINAREEDVASIERMLAPLI